jgi:predicted ATPase
MKRLLLNSLSLMSHQEKAAVEVRFHPKVTVIKGGNDTGKSSLI